MTNLYGTDWRVLACEGCGAPLGDNTMGGLHTKCSANPEPGNRKTAPAYRRVQVVRTDQDLAALAAELQHIAEEAFLPDGDGVTVPVTLWAEGWLLTLAQIGVLPAAPSAPTQQRTGDTRKGPS